ncbi:MAG: hypothetical protein QXV42_05340, partial [Ignisphaera sp.]
VVLVLVSIFTSVNNKSCPYAMMQYIKLTLIIVKININIMPNLIMFINAFTSLKEFRKQIKILMINTDRLYIKRAT